MDQCYQPNNRMLIYDKSYSPKQLERPDFEVSSIDQLCI